MPSRSRRSFFALLLLVPFGPRLGWRKGDLSAALRTLAPALGIALVTAVAILAFTSPHTLAGAGAFGVAAWLIAASAIDLRARGIKTLQAGALASALAHAGLGVTLDGRGRDNIVEERSARGTWTRRNDECRRPYTLRFDGVKAAQGPNYDAARATITVLSGGREIAVMHPEKRIFPAEGQDTIQTAIRTTDRQ